MVNGHLDFTGELMQDIIDTYFAHIVASRLKPAVIDVTYYVTH